VGRLPHRYLQGLSHPSIQAIRMFNALHFVGRYVHDLMLCPARSSCLRVLNTILFSSWIDCLL
jgi:hypothetical protein